MKLLVTGGSGFIGSNFIQYWFKHHPEDTILNLDKLTYAGNPENTKEFADNKKYTFVQGDICDKDSVDLVMKDIDTVVHFAAESHVDRSISNPDIFIKTNVLGTHVLLEAALKNKVKHFHHVSTDEVFGALALDTPDKFDEQTMYDPHSPYSASKAASDHLVRSYFHTFGLPITITNCSNNYGPKQSPEKFLPRSITELLQNKSIKIYGDGKYVRDWLHVEDHCSAIESVLLKGTIGETYLVGGLTEDITNLALAKLLLKIMNKDATLLEFVKDRAGHDTRYAVNWNKIKNELGWTPKYSFEEGLKDTVSWYESNPDYWDLTKKEAESFYAKR
jgi:dTDP-glucose 4,6-dehydratase